MGTSVPSNRELDDAVFRALGPNTESHIENSPIFDHMWMRCVVNDPHVFRDVDLLLGF